MCEIVKLQYLVHMEEHKKSSRNNKCKISVTTCDEEFEYPKDLIPYHTFRVISNTSSTLTDKPPTEIYANRFKNKVTCKTRFGYYLKFLIPEAMKVLESTE